MTFHNAPWALNGASIGAALPRRAMYATARQEGIVLKPDLKVTQLGTPGVGVQIAAGVCLVLNQYQTNGTINEMYVASNPTSYTIPSNEMPASNPAAKSYIVAVVIGDKDFSQTGHPWMLATDPPAGQETTFQYVRPTIIEVSAGQTTLDVAYPAYPLARIDIPANTTTIIDSYITDLRALANPRQSQEIFVSPGGTWNNTTPVRIPAAAAYADWGPAEYAPSVKVPSWATRAIVVASINGVVQTDSSVNVAGNVRTQLGSVSGPATSFDRPVGSGAQRDNLQCAGTYTVTSLQGTTVQLRVEGYENVPTSPTANQRLALQAGSQMIFDVRFFEE